MTPDTHRNLGVRLDNVVECAINHKLANRQEGRGAFLQHVGAACWLAGGLVVEIALPVRNPTPASGSELEKVGGPVRPSGGHELGRGGGQNRYCYRERSLARELGRGSYFFPIFHQPKKATCTFYVTLLSASECKSERRRGRFRVALCDGVSSPFAKNATIACGSIIPEFCLAFVVLGP